MMNNYKSWFFDCDGVILDSNNIKSKVFYEIAFVYGKDIAEHFVKYHQQMGGVTRFKKLEYLFSEILKKNNYDNELKESLNLFSIRTKEELKICNETKGVRNFLSKIDSSKSFVVSGGEQNDLREVLKQKSLDRYFCGIFGGPTSKEKIVEAILRKNVIESPVFIGDSLYDYKVAKKFGFDFIFVSGYTEFSGWKAFFQTKQNVRIVENFSDLLDIL